MKQTFSCGHTGKGKYCHACAAAEKQKAEQRLALEQKRAAKQSHADDPIDLSIVRHLAAVQREARELLGKVSNGAHPLSLDGKYLRSTAGKVLSVPVGRSYRLLFDAPSLTPLRLVSHEQYNAIAASRVAA